MKTSVAMTLLALALPLVLSFYVLTDRAYHSGYDKGVQAQSSKQGMEHMMNFADGYQSGMARCIQDQKGYS